MKSVSMLGSHVMFPMAKSRLTQVLPMQELQNMNITTFGKSLFSQILIGPPPSESTQLNVPFYSYLQFIGVQRCAHTHTHTHFQLN